MNGLFNPVAMNGAHPGRRKIKRVNYCFKSSCEINEILKHRAGLRGHCPHLMGYSIIPSWKPVIFFFLPIILLNTVTCSSHATRLLIRPRLAEMVYPTKGPFEIWMPIQNEHNSDDLEASRTVFCKYIHPDNPVEFCLHVLFVLKFLRWRLGQPRLIYL